VDEQTLWDVDLFGPGTRTLWDEDLFGAGTETQWDLVPAIIGRSVRVQWQKTISRVKWLRHRSGVKWL